MISFRIARRFALCALILVATRSALATSINLVFDTSAGNFPAYDPTGSKLEVLANAAKSMWTSLLPESGHDYSVTVHYRPFDVSDTKFGEYNGFDHSVSIRNNWTWFQDPTPLLNDEFKPFNQVLEQGLTAVEKASFDGPVP